MNPSTRPVKRTGQGRKAQNQATCTDCVMSHRPEGAIVRDNGEGNNKDKHTSARGIRKLRYGITAQDSTQY